MTGNKPFRFAFHFNLSGLFLSLIAQCSLILVHTCFCVFSGEAKGQKGENPIEIIKNFIH